MCSELGHSLPGSWHRAAVPAIVFHGQHIVSATLDDGLRRIASAVQSIHGHDTAFELKHLDQFQGAGCFVVARRQNIGERQTGLRGPGCHHYRRHMALASFVGSPERFAVQGDYAVDFHRLGKGRREAPERLLQRLGVEHAEDTAEGVVARNTVLQCQNRAQRSSFARPNTSISVQYFAPHSPLWGRVGEGGGAFLTLGHIARPPTPQGGGERTEGVARSCINNTGARAS